MRNEILSYLEMCQRERLSLQRGMNFRTAGTYSIILMSTRSNAPYRDRLADGGSTLIYEGHDVSRTSGVPDPKKVDQPQFTSSGALTENGKFHNAAQDHKQGLRYPQKVRVYEKIRDGIWSFNGTFDLVDSWVENDGRRTVFKFKLYLSEDDEMHKSDAPNEYEPQRIIPSSVKLEVWKRDGGKCVVCGASSELHFDHIIPFSRGGTSLKAENIQILCARHNLVKKDKIECLMSISVEDAHLPFIISPKLLNLIPLPTPTL